MSSMATTTSASASAVTEERVGGSESFTNVLEGDVPAQEEDDSGGVYVYWVWGQVGSI